MKMKQRLASKILIYFLCFTFVLLMSDFPRLSAEARQIRVPIGEIVSRGDVKFEAKEKVWKNIEPLGFPIFQKGKIKTEKGTGIITLTNNCQMEVGQYSTLFIDQMDQLDLSRGKLSFRIPSESNVILKVGSLYVTKSRILQAAKNHAIGSPRYEETIGSVFLHSNGSVTVKSVQGTISVLDQDRLIVAALSTREAITIPSVTTIASGKPRTMVAQAGEFKEEKNRDRKRAGALWWDTDEWEYLGLNAIEWIAVCSSIALIGGLTYAFWPKEDKERRVEQLPLCP